MAQTNGEKRVTLQDVAKRTGYSLTAVSRALRNMSDIGPEATKHIKETAAQMGYVPNQTAVALRYGRTHIITLILVDFSNPFFSIITDLIQIAAQSAGYSLMVFCSRNSSELEQQLVDQAIGRRVDGVLLFPTSKSGPSIDKLRAAHMPVVLLSCYLEPDVVDSVISNDEEGAYLAVRHLAEAGHRRIVYISSGEIAPSYLPRKRGFDKACQELQMEKSDYQCRIIPELSLSPAHQSMTEHEKEIERQLLQLKSDGFTGLFVYCDIEAWRIIDILQRSNRLEREDFGIIGFDNIDGALNSPTNLCSVDTGLRDMAQESIALLRSRIHGDERPPQTIVCPASIVCRKSCSFLEE